MGFKHFTTGTRPREGADQAQRPVRRHREFQLQLGRAIHGKERNGSF